MYKKIIIILIFLNFLIIPFCIHAEEDSQFSFAVMGCAHFGVCDAKDYESAVEKMKQYNPDFVLFLGGMVDAIREKPVEFLWKEFDRITEKLGVPVYDIPSDIAYSCGLQPLSVPLKEIVLMEKCFLDRYKKRYYSFEHKNNLFICLDSEKEPNFIDRNQLDFLKKTIADVSKYNNVFIAVHRSPSVPTDSEWFEVIHPIINGKVKYVFGAYRHSLDLKKIDNVTYIASGCPPCLNSQVIPSFFHFLMVEVDKKGVSIKVIPLKPVPIETWKSYGEKTERIAARFIPSAVRIGILMSNERESILSPTRIIKTLNIKPGMDILDLGAGSGFFTFPFAEALKGTGKVFATDTDSSMIEYIKDKIEEGKYKNIFPVLVRPEGVGPFYKQHTFDIIFLSEVYHYLQHPGDYFRELRPALKKTGRLYILHFKNVSNFSEFEFDDFKKVIEVLISKGKDFPIFQRLRQDVQYFIKNWRGENVPSEIRRKIIQDFNKMLSDKLLFHDLVSYYVEIYKYDWAFSLRTILYPADIRLAQWLIVNLDENGVFDKKEKEITNIDKKCLHLLNRILLTGIFQSDRLRALKGDPSILLEKNSVISTLKAAGYKFVREYNFLTQCYFLEFKREY